MFFPWSHIDVWSNLRHIWPNPVARSTRPPAKPGCGRRAGSTTPVSRCRTRPSSSSRSQGWRDFPEDGTCKARRRRKWLARCERTCRSFPSPRWTPRGWPLKRRKPRIATACYGTSRTWISLLSWSNASLGIICPGWTAAWRDRRFSPAMRILGNLVWRKNF